MMPDVATLYGVIDGTWPAARVFDVGPWTIRDGAGGGQRVSSATMRRPVSAGDLPGMEQAMRDLGQPPLVMVRAGEDALDALLADAGYRVVDPVNLYVAPVGDIATEYPPPVTAFTVWEPLAIQLDIWAEGGIGPGRIAVMERAKGPKTSILGRLNDSPACAAFVGIHDGIAMLHALEVLPHQRQQGMGIYAMRMAAFWARDNGASHLSVVCTRANRGANALYTSLGMTLVGQYHYRKKFED